MARALPKISYVGLRVAKAFLDSDEKELYATQIMAAANAKSGTIQPILARLKKAGWLASRRETGTMKSLGRPRRNFYRMTDGGRTMATNLLSALQMGDGK